MRPLTRQGFRKKEQRVKTTRNKRWQIRTLTISLAGIVCCVFTAGAAQEPYDLDLRELRRPPVHRTKSRAPTRKPKPAVTAPPQQADTLHDRKIAVTAPFHPCQLAREVAEQLNVQISALPPFIVAEGINVSTDIRKIAVVCGLEPAEAYTLDRLLAQEGVKLLLLKNDETPKSVIEGVAGGLGIPFSATTAGTAVDLPQTYLFPAAIAGKDLRLTLLPGAAP